MDTAVHSGLVLVQSQTSRRTANVPDDRPLALTAHGTNREIQRSVDFGLKQNNTLRQFGGVAKSEVSGLSSRPAQRRLGLQRLPRFV